MVFSTCVLSVPIVALILGIATGEADTSGDPANCDAPSDGGCSAGVTSNALLAISRGKLVEETSPPRPSQTAMLLLGGWLAVPSSSASLRAGSRAASTSNTSLHARALPPYYHSSADISDALKTLARDCPGLSVQFMEETGSTGRKQAVEVVSMKKPGTEPTNRVFILFGEHSRELISAESGLHFVRTLCGQHGELADEVSEVLKESEFKIVVNGNPRSRAKVEQGDFCLRTDPDGVDLNRNWDEKWTAGDNFGNDDTNPGPEPFSEPETRVFKALVEEYRPTTFLTIHSGTKGMYMPWAFDMEHLATRNKDSMMEILRLLDEKHCECPFGAAGREVGYSCPGTCLDWVYDKLGTPYAFAFEIYVGPQFEHDLQRRWKAKMEAENGRQHQEESFLAHPHFQDLFHEHPSSFIQLKSSSMSKRHLMERSRRNDGDEDADSDDDDDSETSAESQRCFNLFNPNTEAKFNSVVENWSEAYLEMAAMVASKLREGANATATA